MSAWNVELAAKTLLQGLDKPPSHEMIVNTLDKMAEIIGVKLDISERRRAFEFVEYYTRKEITQ